MKPSVPRLFFIGYHHLLIAFILRRASHVLLRQLSGFWHPLVELLVAEAISALPGQHGFPCGLAGKEYTCNEGNLSLIPGLKRTPWRRERLPTPVFWRIPWTVESMGSQRVDRTERLSLHFLLNKLGRIQDYPEPRAIAPS